jgi:hypothetical protein
MDLFDLVDHFERQPTRIVREMLRRDRRRDVAAVECAHHVFPF